uniref:Uncharacterized protein n=1 Tax=Timema genevievae TaxID=629358 RepID=A0A7R9K839_TIMGE|nr:unnamed protein product [Timema genevievae]
MDSLVLIDSSQLTADGFEKLPDQIICELSVSTKEAMGLLYVCLKVFGSDWKYFNNVLLYAFLRIKPAGTMFPSERAKVPSAANLQLLCGVRASLANLSALDETATPAHFPPSEVIVCVCRNFLVPSKSKGSFSRPVSRDTSPVRPVAEPWTISPRRRYTPPSVAAWVEQRPPVGSTTYYSPSPAPRTTLRRSSQVSESVSTFAWSDGGKPCWKTTRSTPDRDYHLDLPVIDTLVYCDSSALDHAATKVVLTTASADDDGRYYIQGARPKKKRRAPPPPTPPPALHQASNTSLTSGDNTSSSETSNNIPHQNSSDLIQSVTNETEPIVEQTEIDHEALRLLVNRIQTEFTNEEGGIEAEENASQRNTISFAKCSSAKTCNVERESSGSNESLDDVSLTIEHPNDRSLVKRSGSNELKDDVSLTIEHPNDRSLIKRSGSNELKDDVSLSIEHPTSGLLTEESGNNELPDDVSLPIDHLTTDSLIEASNNQMTFDSSITLSSGRGKSDESINNNLSDLTVEESKRKVESNKDSIHSLTIKEGSDIATVVVVSSEKTIPIIGKRVDEREEIENVSEVKYVSKIPNNNLMTIETSERTTSNRNFELLYQVDSNNCDNIKTNSDNLSEEKNNSTEMLCTNTITRLNKDVVSSDITRVTPPNESTETTKKDATVVETNIEEVRNGLVETSIASRLEFDDGNKSPTKEVPPEIPVKKTNNRFFRSLKTTKKEPLTSSPTPPPRSKPQPTPRIKRLKKLFAS